MILIEFVGVPPDMNMIAAGLSATEHLDHSAASSIKQLLISSYKKIVAPALRADLHNSCSCDQHISSAATINRQRKFFPIEVDDCV